jgi:hypothetical protein
MAQLIAERVGVAGTFRSSLAALPDCAVSDQVTASVISITGNP